LFAARLLLFATCSRVRSLATNATQATSLAASLYILSFVFTLVGIGVAVDGFRRMTRRQA